MPLVSTCEMLVNAQAQGTAIGAFNIESLEMAQAVIDAAAEASRPVILQTTPSTLKYAHASTFAAIVSSIASMRDVQVAMHLDHGNSLELVGTALSAGYTSVMIDGSTLSLAENIAISKAAVALANGVPVEAELGSVGGKEDDHEAENAYTNPNDAAEFVAQTGVQSLAIAIGTAHGIYSGVPKLDMDRLVEIRKNVSIPLVLHGASGLPDEAIAACVKEGICKVNFATELRIAYTNGVRAYLQSNPDAYDPKAYGKAGYEQVRKLALDKIRLLAL